MKTAIQSTLTLAALAFLQSSTTAAPLQELQPRQASTEWNDIYIDEPTNFQLRNAGNSCDVQFTFERDFVDSRYSYRFQAEYASGERIKVSPKTTGRSGDLPISRAGEITTVGKYSISNGKVLSVHTFENICSSNSPPTAFYALTELDTNWYTYSNNFTSSAIGYSSDNYLPGVPTGVVATKARNPNNNNRKTTKVRWSKVEGASQYFVLYKYYIYASELGTDVAAYRTSLVDGSKLEDSQNVDAEYISVVARRGDGAVSKSTEVDQVLVRNV